MILFWTIECGADAPFEFIGGEEPIWLKHTTLAMHPFWLNWVEPGAFARSKTEHNPHAALLSGLNVLVVGPNPLPDDLTAMPGGIIPNQQPGRFAFGSQLGAAPG